MSAQRQRWVAMLRKVAGPVLEAMAQRKLRATMPVQQQPDARREQTTHLEALGRTLAGVGPWLQLTGGDSAEAAARQQLFDHAVAAIDAATDSQSPDRLDFTAQNHGLVDAAFLSQGLMRAPRLWQALGDVTRTRLLDDLRLTRRTLPGFNNWLLFSAEIEAMLHRAGQSWDMMRVDYALRQHEQWYVGDGTYGDGPRLHHDYYNSFVIQPMLLDVMDELGEPARRGTNMHQRALQRAQRYAVVQERMIGPDGSYPVIGRSIAYRCGAFGLLAQLAWQKRLPDELKPAQVRGALSAVIERALGAPGTFDAQGFLRIGLAGDQPSLGERYISTGSLYLCTTAFAPLGLPAGDPFWADADEPWTAVKAWSGVDIPADHARNDQG